MRHRVRPVVVLADPEHCAALAADVHARYLRATGRRVLCAGRAPLPPELGALFPGGPPADAEHRRTVLEQVTALHAAGRFRLRRVRLPYARGAGVFLHGGMLRGTCPVCLAACRGGACGHCGHPNDFDGLLEPRYALDPADPVVHVEREVLVLPMEEHRERLTSYCATRAPRWRPRARQAVAELLARPLPDVPVTFPGPWGTAAPFPETPGQVLHPAIEAVPSAMHGTWWAGAGPRADSHWLADADAEVLVFHGFTDVHQRCLVDPVVLLAHGDRYVLPEGLVCTESYTGDGELPPLPKDLLRFHLAMTAPEFQPTPFPRDADEVARRLVEPWNALADAVALALSGVDPGQPLPTTPAARGRALAVAERFRSCYQLAGFSLGRAASTVLAQVDRLGELACRGGPPGDLLLEVRTLLAGAAPVLVDVGDELLARGVDLALGVVPPEAEPVFRVPRLPAARVAPRQSPAPR